MNQSARHPVNAKAAEARVAGHFGELVQGRLGTHGPIALVTLPCPALVSTVHFAPGPTGAPLEVDEAVSVKAASAARAALERLGAHDLGGRISIRRPVDPGLGAGSSTAETLGAIRAVAAALGREGELDADAEALLCLAAEGAIDPLMHLAPDGRGDTLLFASREGQVLERLPPLPRMSIVGGFAGPARVTDPRDTDFTDMSAAFDRLRRALEAGDPVGLGRASTRSAAANQAARPNPAFAEALAISERLRGFGVAVGHTGAAIALLLPEDADTCVARRELGAAGVRGIIDWQAGL